MDLVQGKTLQTLIKERGQLSLDDVESIFTQLCFGLASGTRATSCSSRHKTGEYHDCGWASLSAEGSVKIPDFELPQIVNEDRGRDANPHPNWRNIWKSILHEP